VSAGVPFRGFWRDRGKKMKNVGWGNKKTANRSSNFAAAIFFVCFFFSFCPFFGACLFRLCFLELIHLGFRL
jgi:hypothetical protein